MSVPLRSARVPNRLHLPITILVRYEDVADGLRSGSMRGRFEVYTESEVLEVEIAGQRVPLEYETTSALAYGLGRSKMWDFEIAGFRRGDLLRVRDALPIDDGLLMLEPYRPGKIPIVLVHGTASSPARWAEMLNEFQSDPIIRAGYQFWFFIYSTGNPILYSASLLREALSETLAELDPERRDPALQRMVVIGHSQGGLLTRLQVVSSGTRFWDNFSDKSFEEVEIAPDTRETIGRAFFFERQEFIERVIFISTPHRGSFLADTRLGNFASRLAHAPTNLLSQSADLARAGVDLVESAVDGSRGFLSAFFPGRMKTPDWSAGWDSSPAASTICNRNPRSRPRYSRSRLIHPCTHIRSFPVLGDPAHRRGRTTVWSRTRAPTSKKRRANSSSSAPTTPPRRIPIRFKRRGASCSNISTRVSPHYS